MNKPKISVVIPVRNRADLIAETIRSFIAQEDFNDFEIIVIDDHSTDNIVEVISTFKDERIKFFRLKDDFGQGKVCARNFGNMLAQGEIIAVCDSDDMAKPNRLKMINKAFIQNSTAGVFYSDGEVLDEIMDIKRDRRLIWSEFDLDRLLKENYIAHTSLAYRKNIAMTFPYNPFFAQSEDYELVLRLAKNKIEFIASPQKLFIQRIHKNRESQIRSKQDLFAKLARDIHFGQLQENILSQLLDEYQTGRK